MKKLFWMSIIAVLTAASIPAMAADEGNEKLDNRITAAQDVLKEIMATPDKAVPDAIARKAVCVGIVPGMKKGAFIIGADYGQGVVTCRTHDGGWSAPAFIRMAGGSWGLQAGGQSTDLVLVAMNEKGFQDLLHDKFKIGADASAAAGPVGRNAQASTDLMMHAELLTWSRSRGVFAGIDLSGTVVSQNNDDTEAFYGRDHSFEHILRGSVPTPPAARGLIHTVEQYFGQAQADR